MKHFCVRIYFKLFLLLCFVGTNAVSYGQGDAKISLNSGSITIKNALEEVAKQAKLSVAYNESKLNGNKTISINVKSQNLNEALETILLGTDFTYQVKEGYIMIVPKKDSSERKTITGKITDERGEPIVGASINLRGTIIGAATDYDGSYSLSVPKGGVLLVSFLGYTTQEIIIDNRNVYDVRLVPESTELDAVVVTALGIKRATKALSYNVQEVKQEELTRNKDANFINALTGKVAGVTINSSSSGVGGASKVIMRGTRGIEQSSSALYVIDGIPMFNLGREEGTEFGSAGATEAIADINPEDIESISVLTGAAAAALYGNQASNGAVVITTKKGKAGQTKLTLSHSTEFMNIFISPEFQNRYGTGSSLTEVAVLDRSWGKPLNSKNFMGYSPKDDYLKTGMMTMESVTFSTGTERNQTYLSAGAVNSIGIIPNNEYERYNFTFRNTSSFVNDKMLLDVGASYIKQLDQNMVNQGVYSNPLVTAYLFPRGDDWNDIKMYERYNSSRKINVQYWPQGIDEFVGQNPYWINYRNLRNNNKDRYMMNANLSYDIFSWLNVSGRIRIDHSENEYTEKFYASSNTNRTEGSEKGLYGISTTKDKQLYGDFLVNINKTFNDFTVQANLGTSLSDMRQNMLKIRGPIREDGLSNRFDIAQLDNSKTKRSQDGWHDQTQSIFASMELGYRSTYYLTLTGRNDWPSQLAGPNSSVSSFFYPSVGTSIIVSEALNLPKQINYLKVRASFASVGLPFPRFLANPVFLWNEETGKYWTKTHYPLYKLKAERTDSWEVGLTTKLLRHINLDLSFYYTKTYNQTFDSRISASSSFTKFYVQAGSVQNRGMELSLGYQNTWGKFSWSSNYTFSANQNKILELDYIHPLTGELVNVNHLNVGGLSQARFLLKKEGSLGDLYSLSDLQRDSNGNIYVDPKGSVYTNNKAGDIKLGSVFPKCNMGWRNDLSWRNFNLSFLVSARLGGIVYSATQATLDNYGVSETTAIARDRGGIVVNGGDVISAEKWYTTIGSNSGIPQYYTYSASNVRLQEASIGYTLSKDKFFGIAEISLSLIGRNLLMIYNKAPFDPESVATTGNYYQGIDYFMMPSTRNWGFNVKVTF